MRIDFYRFLECVTGFLGAAFVCQDSAEVVPALACAGRIQFSGLLKILCRFVDFSGGAVHNAEVVVIRSLVGLQLDGLLVRFGGFIILFGLRISVGKVREDHVLRRVFFRRFLE